MIAGDNLPGANVNETNPAGVNHVPNAGDEATNNGGAVDDPANNDNGGGGDNFDKGALDLHQSSASDSDSSDDDQDSEEDEEVEEA